MKVRSGWWVAAVTWSSVFAILLMVLLAGVGSAEGIENYNSGGNTAAVVLMLIALLPLTVHQVRFRSRKWFAWIVASTSAALALALSLSSIAGPTMLSWSIYGGLQVPKAPESFNDLAWIFRWAECDGCAEEFPGYSQGVLWLKPLTFGQLSEGWAIPIGIVMILLMSLALGWLVRASEAGAAPVYFIVSIGTGWLLLIERANADVFVILAILAIVLVYRRYNHLWVWSVIAAGVWWLGTWKYYPFALGILLLPVLFIKRGWLVIAGFISATLVFVLANRESQIEGFTPSQLGIYLEDSPAFSRVAILVRMAPEIDLDAFFTGPNLLIFFAAAMAFFWGWLYSVNLRVLDTPKSLMALGGSGMFIANVLVNGFGFAYKAAFLVLLIPLLALGLRRNNAFALYTSIVSLVLTSLSAILTYSILLASLSAILAASIGAGAASGVLYRKIRTISGETPWPLYRLGVGCAATKVKDHNPAT